MKQIALIGNPNSGKTTLFNALTGLRHKTGNYPGVTVEKREGSIALENGEEVRILDLPGAYSLLPRSPDEEIVHHVLLGLQKDTPVPDLVLAVLDSANFERNMYLVSQVIETRIPVILVFNMWDLAEENGIHIHLEVLEKWYSLPCIPMVGHQPERVSILKKIIQQQLTHPRGEAFSKQWSIPEVIRKELESIGLILKREIPLQPEAVAKEALRMLTDRRNPKWIKGHSFAAELEKELDQKRTQIAQLGIDLTSLEPEGRYQFIDGISRRVLKKREVERLPVSERLDHVLTHPIWGLVLFLFFMAFIFQSIFSWAQWPMELISKAINEAGHFLSNGLPEGALKSLLVDGIIAGVGNVAVFLPQILLLFFFIAFFEDSGYMARAAFVLDRIMKKVGLNGKAFLPLLSSFACAVPGIMAARTVEDKNDRLATILVAPLMSCSARLPVYTLLIAAFIPSRSVWGILNLQGLTLFLFYFLGIICGLGMAFLFRKSFLRGSQMPFIFELPPYRIPHMRNLMITMWDRAKEFIYRAGGVILLVSIILWFLLSYPKPQGASLLEIPKPEAQMSQSYAGQMGRWLEPVLKPLGFDWKIGVGLIASVAARELMVSTLAIVYRVSSEDSNPMALSKAMQKESRTGLTPLKAFSLMIFFTFAFQCISTFIIVRHETNSWRWPFFMWAYMTFLAWMASLMVYQGGRFLGFS